MSGKTLLLLTIGTFGLSGIASGWIFGRAQYYKGQMDAYNSIAQNLEETTKNIEECIKRIEGDDEYNR